MSSVAISGNASGAGVFTIAAPNSASSFTATLPAATTTLVGTDATQTLTNKTLTSPTITGAVVSSMASSVITSGTAVASTSGTSIDFTSIPSWVKRITVMFSGVSLSGTSSFLIQLGDAGGFEITAYVSLSTIAASTVTTASNTTGFLVTAGTAARSSQGIMQICSVGSNTWVEGGNFNDGVGNTSSSSGTKTLSGTLDRVRITTVNGTDTFDAGTINILYE